MPECQGKAACDPTAQCKISRGQCFLENTAQMVPRIDSTALLQAHRRKQYNDMFDTMFKQQLDLIGENELLKHEHTALEERLERMQRELDISNQWRLEADEEVDQVTDELTLFKETLHAQGFRLPNGDPIIVSQSPLGFEE